MKAPLVLVGLLLMASDQVAVTGQPQAPGVKTEASSTDKTAGGKRSASRMNTQNSDRELAGQRERALQVLDQLSDIARSLKTDEWTLRVRAHIADLLWNSDRERARGNFEEIFRAVDAIQLPDPTDKNSSAQRMPTKYLRSEVLGLISRHDPGMAENLIRTIDTDAAGSETRSEAAIQREKSFLALQMATALVDSNPSKAVDLMVSSLDNGLTSWFAVTLQALRRKNPVMADDVFAKALSLAQEDKEHAAKNIRLLAASLSSEPSGPMVMAISAEDEDGVSVGFDLSAVGSGRAASLAVTKQFLDFVYKTFMQTPVPTDQAEAQAEGDRMQALENSMTARMLLPMFDQHLPDQSALLRVRLNEISKSLNFGEGQSLETLLNFLSPSASSQELLNRAQCQKDPDLRDTFYQQAAQVAARNGEMDKIAFILDKVNSERAKSSVRSTVAYVTTTGALARNDLDAAYQSLKDLSEPSQKAQFLTQMAQKLHDHKDDPRAMQWLTEAEELAGKADQNLKFYTQVSIADVTAELDPDRGFIQMTTIVREINQSSARSHETADTESGQDIAIRGVDSDVAIANTLLQSKTFTYLVRADFDAALALAESILHQQSSMAAQLGVCRGMLAQSTDERTGKSKKRGEEK
jgi:hypothetical protein